MKHLLSGTAIAAALVIAAPVWAQTSAIPRPPAAPTAASAPNDTMGSHMRIHRVKARHRHATRRGSARASDNMANQLNAEELAKSGGGMAAAPARMGGAPPPPAYGGPTTAPYGQPNQLYGIPGAAQPSPSGPPR
jgi:hypothetical protein